MYFVLKDHSTTILSATNKKRIAVVKLDRLEARKKAGMLDSGLVGHAMGRGPATIRIC